MIPETKKFYERVSCEGKYGLYAVITEKFCAGRKSVRVLESVVGSGVKIVQLREKNLSPAELLDTARIYREVTRSFGALFIVNDYPQLAAAAAADGVHLGQNDAPLACVRARPPGLMTGVSVHTSEEALAAERAGATYVNIGPVFPTTTKENASAPVGISAVSAICPILKIPFSVMGGIKEGNIPSVAAAGARLFAMVTEISAADDIPAKILRLRSVLASLPDHSPRDL